MRLRRSDVSAPGIRRSRRGRGFTYHWDDGRPVTDAEVLTRIRALTIPPAWRDVWIAPWPHGHIQAVGTDAAGRRQYRYHDAWRAQRDRAKHDRILEFASRLERSRKTAAAHLREEEDLTRTRVLASAARLLDLGFFRVGGEEYAEENGTYGLATIRKDHVRVDGDTVVFSYPAKGAKQRVQAVVDPVVRDVVRALRQRRGGGAELLAYRDGGRWCDVKSSDINDYLREVIGEDVTAKDFRTWHATVLMAVALAVSAHAAGSPSARKRAVARAYREVADYLGNTPAVCRASYVDPRVVDLYLDGLTVAPALERLGEAVDIGQPATVGAVERAVLDLLGEPRESRTAVAG